MNSKYNDYGINNESYMMFFYKDEKVNMNKKMKVIRAFTSNNYLYQFFYKLQGYSIQTLDTSGMKLRCYDDDIEFFRLSDLLIGDNEYSNSIKSELLNYNKRKGQCHYRSIEFLQFIEGKLVTGYVDDEMKKCRIVHSFIETEKGVVDYTSNLVIGKDDYYKLMNVEVLSTIKKEELLEDYKSEFLRKYIGCKFYCLFRDELVKQGFIKNDEDFSYQKRLTI